MARPYSMDLRERVVQAVEQEGLSRRQAAERFGIGIKTAIDWLRRFRETGSMAAKPMGGCRPKKIVGQHRDWLLERCRGQDLPGMSYQNRIDPAPLVFIDETWTKTNMAPLRTTGAGQSAIRPLDDHDLPGRSA